jgi:hypothetical protein
VCGAQINALTMFADENQALHVPLVQTFHQVRFSANSAVAVLWLGLGCGAASCGWRLIDRCSAFLGSSLKHAEG